MPDRIVVLGTGAMATYFASRLSAVGVDVLMLGTWGEAIDNLNHGGAQIEGEAAHPVQAMDIRSFVGRIFQSLLLVKSWQTHQVINSIASSLDEHGMVVSLQNGLGYEKCYHGYLHENQFARGVTTCGVTLLSPGLVRLSSEGPIWIEEKRGDQFLISLLRASRFMIHAVANITPFVWGKLVINCAINPLTAILGIKNGQLLDDPLALVVMKRIACEAAEVATMLGVELPYNDIEQAVEAVAWETKDNISSMLSDYSQGRKTEIDEINGAVVKAGKKTGANVTLNALMLRLVKNKKRISSYELFDMVQSLI